MGCIIIWIYIIFSINPANVVQMCMRIAIVYERFTVLMSHVTYLHVFTGMHPQYMY